ncbi:energy transducer TonB [Candidatus Marinarcus aquaticus]|uniref:TonB C-terminal domain-containing protein n=1 Tax=Candidatus Marinarcus aquaticus TaxID=2044504 RepID=A0A4Q0XSE6_9BACT|nr:energy transducer TonB [Candidatus Marinarcus aquaticus]RXJ57656.1 hypothetical protein CRV04_07545 [Candidatus Marinarcus aquaticus]
MINRRLAIALGGSVAISIAIFALMQQMISSDAQLEQKKQAPIELNYLRDKKETDIEKKTRIQPKKPIEKVEPKKLDFKKELNQNLNKNVKVQPLAIANNLDLSNITSLKGAQLDIGSSLIDANMLTALSRSNPRYPRMAKIRKQEGFVQLIFKIDAQGFVSDIKVAASDPKGVFEDSAVSAMKRWRFKPTKGDAPGSFKEATITFNFRLAQ